MKTEYEIYMNYQMTRQQADVLCGIAAAIRQSSGEMLAAGLAALKENWTGDAGALFQQKGQCLSDSVLASAEAAEQTASVMRESAENLYEAEMYALEIARSRNCD